MRFFLFSALVFVAMACNYSRDKILMQTPWKFDMEATRELLKEKSVSESQVNYMEGVMKRLGQTTLEFKKENLLVLRMPDGDSTLGYWAIKGNQILMQVTKESAPPYNILEMTPQRIMLEPTTKTDLDFVRVLVPVVYVK